MAFNLGNSAISDLRLGTTEVASAYLGTSLVYSSKVATPSVLIPLAEDNGSTVTVSWRVQNNDTSQADVYTEVQDNTPDFHVETLSGGGASGTLMQSDALWVGFNTVTIYSQAKITGRTDSDIDAEVVNVTVV